MKRTMRSFELNLGYRVLKFPCGPQQPSIDLNKRFLPRRYLEFSNGGYKIRKIFALESTYPKKIIRLSFGQAWFWINGELSKSAKI